MPPAAPPCLEELSTLESCDARDVVAWAVERFGSRLTLSCSFGGPGGMALLDLAWRVNPAIDVFVLDTGFLFDETLHLLEEVERRYGIEVRRIRPLLSPDEQAKRLGPELWKSDPDACCAERKVEPMHRALSGYDGWLTALRRDQSATRAQAPVAAWDEQFGIIKLCPLADWSGPRLWDYVKQHELPVNPLLVRDYRSIGCVQCTARTFADGDERAGRWAGFTKTECGLHARR